MQCSALTSSHGARCRNPADPGSIFCHDPSHAPGWPLARSALQELRRHSLEELRELEGLPPELLEGGSGERSPRGPAEDPDPGPEAREAAEPTEPEPDRAEFSRGSDQHPSGSDPLEGLERDGGPDSEAPATPPSGHRDVDPGIFEEFRSSSSSSSGEDQEKGPRWEEGELELEDEPEAGPPHPSELARGSLLDRNPGPYTEEHGRKVQRALLNPLFRRTGKEPLSPEEEEFGAEPWAAALNHILGRVDPNTPWGAMTLYAVIVGAPRYAPDLMNRAVVKVTGRDPSSSSSGEDQEDQELDASSNGSSPEKGQEHAEAEADSWPMFRDL